MCYLMKPQIRAVPAVAERDADDPVVGLAAALAAVIEKAVRDAVAVVRLSPANSKQALFSVPEAAKALGLGTTTVKKLIASGDLPSITVGRRRLVPQSAVDNFGRSRGSLAP